MARPNPVPCLGLPGMWKKFVKYSVLIPWINSFSVILNRKFNLIVPFTCFNSDFIIFRGITYRIARFTSTQTVFQIRINKRQVIINLYLQFNLFLTRLKFQRVDSIIYPSSDFIFRNKLYRPVSTCAILSTSLDIFRSRSNHLLCF